MLMLEINVVTYLNASIPKYSLQLMNTMGRTDIFEYQIRIGTIIFPWLRAEHYFKVLSIYGSMKNAIVEHHGWRVLSLGDHNPEQQRTTNYITITQRL